VSDIDIDAVRRLTARAAIQDLLTRVALAQDAHDWSTVGDCFAPDALYLHPSGQLEGAAAIVERARRALTPLDASQHLLGTMLVEVGDGVASSVTYFQAQHVRKGAPGGDLLVIAGSYTDELELIDGRWRIARRTQQYSWRDGNPAVIVRAPGQAAGAR
jgi:ketosteroid isomerase-like protein